MSDNESADREACLQPDALVKRAIEGVRKHKPKKGPSRNRTPLPLWARVKDIFHHGSGYSAEVCRRYGFDPDEQWRPEQQCPDCKRMVDPEELRPAPCNYEQDVNGNDTPYVMCRSCRADRNESALRLAEVACLECVRDTDCAADQECVGGHCQKRRK